MTRTPRTYQLGGLAALETTVEIAMRALVETYPELYREPHSDDSAETATVAQCGRLLATIDAHRQYLARVPSDAWLS